MSRGRQKLKYCQYTGESFKRGDSHRKGCGPCAEDYKQGLFKYLDSPPADHAEEYMDADSSTLDSPAAADAPDAPLRQPLIEIEAQVGEDDALPRYKSSKYPVTAAVVDAAKPAPEMLDKNTIGMLFEAPILLLTEESVGPDGSKPMLSADGKKALVDLWRPILNRAMLSAADKHPDIILAVFGTMLIYGPVTARSIQYRRMKRTPRRPRYKSDTQRGYEEAGIGVEPPPPEPQEVDQEQMQRDIAKRLNR